MQFNYTPNLNGLNIIDNTQDQQKKFFYKGHPEFLIPDFSNNIEDIWITYLDYLESKIGSEIYDQDGGEITYNTVIDKNTGLTKCDWTSYGVMFDEDSDPQDITVEIEGYVVESQNGETYFIATKVIENSK